MEAQNADTDSGADLQQSQQCELCDEPAVVSGSLVVNRHVHPNTPLCEDCHIPQDELSFPALIDEEAYKTEHEDTLITTPADTVIVDGEQTIIRHGPGERSVVDI
jgi:hypothetical protein